MEECRGSAGHALGGMMSCACRQRHVTVHPLPRHFHTSTPPHFLQGMALGYGGNPYGPAGTGKTESVKALGQAFARQVCVSGGGGAAFSRRAWVSPLHARWGGGGAQQWAHTLQSHSRGSGARAAIPTYDISTGCGSSSPTPSSPPLPMPTAPGCPPHAHCGCPLTCPPPPPCRLLMLTVAVLLPALLHLPAGPGVQL